MARPSQDVSAGRAHDWKERAVEQSLYYTCKTLSLYDLTLSIFELTEQATKFGIWHAVRQDREKPK